MNAETAITIASTHRSLCHTIIDLGNCKKVKGKQPRLNSKRETLLKLAINPTSWIIYISADGLRARVVHKELDLTITGLHLYHSVYTERKLVRSIWFNYVSNVLGIRA